MSQSPNDKQELVPTLSTIPAEAGFVAVALVDSGFFSEKAVTQIERAAAGTPTGPLVYAAVEKTGHHRTVAALEKKPEPEPPAAGPKPRWNGRWSAWPATSSGCIASVPD